MMVYALEREAAALEQVIAPLVRRFVRHKLVFVHSALDFRPFMEKKAAFEHLPPLEQVAAFPGLMDWPRYLEERRDLLVAKWRPGRAISYGPGFDGYLAEVRRLACDHG